MPRAAFLSRGRQPPKGRPGQLYWPRSQGFLTSHADPAGVTTLPPGAPAASLICSSVNGGVRIMPTTERSDTYLVHEDFGARLGRALRETDDAATDRETLTIQNLMDGQYGHALRIVAFNTAEGWSRDVTKDIADELRRRLMGYDEVPVSVQVLVDEGCCEGYRHSSSRSRRTAALAGFLVFSHVVDGPLR